MSDHIWGLGRRKTAVARVRIKAGTGRMLVNRLPAEEFFNNPRELDDIQLPLKVLELSGRYDVMATVRGGGKVAQAGAVLLGIARALIRENEAHMPKLREMGFLTRDSRMKERKKPGRRAARARFQFSKR